MVQGRVTDRHTGRALAGAIVQASSPSGLFTTRTDRDGFFAFMSLPTGAARITAVHEGYEPFSVLDVCVDSDQMRYVPIALYPPFHMIASLTATYPQWRCYFGGD
jgi:hypothetical protein